ncbi:unnamed protein product [Ambrosiozyma monospora]|uniref:Unnamed protein product n=1 Tax=Ambrosiozyma monospora TaxID=43982 RepID=A0A9W6Z2P9_AMBMO|nr:unnamed protein product [Ambrosiozyma monospora]
MSDLSVLEGMMEHLQLGVPSLKHLYLNWRVTEQSAKLCDDFLVQANTFIRKHKKLYIKFDIYFPCLPIPTHWRFDSKTQLSLPFHTEHPINTKKVNIISQDCSVSGITSLTARPKFRPFLSNTPKIYFTRAINSTVSTLLLQKFSTEYEIVLDGFLSLKKLEIARSVLKKFPSLPESLRELTIEYVSDLTMSDMDHGIILPTRLCSLIWHGNLSCFTLPKILNIDKLLSLKDVSIRISPLEVSDEFDGSLYDFPLEVSDEFDGAIYDLKHHVTKDCLRLSNTCTIDQLQQFVSQLPPDLEILKINIHGYIRPCLNNYSACLDKVSFKHFTKLDCLELKCFNNSNPFNVSAFPGVESLNFLSPPVLSGSFAQGIKSLEVDLEAYGESVSHFLSHFISKLTSLVCLSIVCSGHRVADIRSLPNQLCSFSITTWSFGTLGLKTTNVDRLCVILDAFPVQLNYLQLFLAERALDIIVDDCKGESISSMAERIDVRDRVNANWIQYSHFDCDEESFGIESLYGS